ARSTPGAAAPASASASTSGTTAMRMDPVTRDRYPLRAEVLAVRAVDRVGVPRGLRRREPQLGRIAPAVAGLRERDDDAQARLAVVLLDGDVAGRAGVGRVAVLEPELPPVRGVAGLGNRRRGGRVVEDREDHELVLPLGAAGREEDAPVGEDR